MFATPSSCVANYLCNVRVWMHRIHDLYIVSFGQSPECFTDPLHRVARSFPACAW